MIKVGETEKALEAAKQLEEEDNWWRWQTLIFIAKPMAKAGEMEKARKLFDQALEAAKE